MTEHRSPEGRLEHLQRVAVEYRRWSTDPQVQKHEGSAGQQREQVEHARGMGWAEDAIVVIEDSGASGTPADRPGFQRLLEMVERGEVGAVFVPDVSRLARSPRDLELFLALCRAKGVTVVVGGEIMELE